MRGFSLLELLVVVAIIAIVTSALVVNAWPGGAAAADTEGRRLAALLESAMSEARVSGQAIAWTPERDGYSFSRRANDGSWEPFPDASVYRARRLAGEASLRAERAVLLPYGTATRIEAAISDRDNIIVLRSGAIGRISLERIHAD
jgi:type II secretion system protein H